MPDTCINIESIVQLAQSSGWRRIGIDGVDGAGKAYLAEQLSEGLSCPALNLDDYLHQNQGGYVDFIDYPALSAALSSMPAFILGGVCLQKVLAELGQDLDASIYIKRMRDDMWIDEDECVFPDGVEAAIENLASSNEMISRGFDEPSGRLQPDLDVDLQLKFEVMHYHEEFSPQETADVVYERSDQPAEKPDALNLS
jgi:hypothetical protein